MEQVSLRARTGRVPGSRHSRRLRREGQVPAVVYGRELEEPLHIAVDARDLYGVLHTDAGLNALITLHVDDGDEILTMARVVERHPFRSEYRHVDFQKIALTETITTEVPIHFEGEPIGVREGDGVFSPARTSVEIEALVTQIPGHVEVDISGLEVGDALRIADMPEVEGVTYLEDPEYVVVSVTYPAAEIEEPEPEAELLEGEEAAEEAVEGEEPSGEESGAEGEETAEEE
ncbi:MAG: 50S ribosomal protein L25 [Actinomycetota bacterium]